MTKGPMQADLFGGETPMAETPAVAVPVAVLRAPGWYLVASRSAPPRTWHLLSSAGTGGTVVARCGLRGHVVSDTQRVIVQCPECLA